VTSTDTKPEVVFSFRGRHLEKWIWRHISGVGASIWTKFGSLMQNNVQISSKWSKSKPKVDFQYGGRFFKNGSSYISAINWDMSTKFGLLIDFDLLKAAISTNAKPEIVLSGRHLDKAIWRPNRSNTISGLSWATESNALVKSNSTICLVSAIQCHCEIMDGCDKLCFTWSVLAKYINKH